MLSLHLAPHRVKVAPAMKTTSVCYRLLLVFALLFAQLGGLVHGITHTLAEQSQDQTQPHDKLCDLCAAYAQVGSALGSNPVLFTAVESGIFFVAAGFSAAYSSAFAAFAARAPPYSA
jgi:hypothetical protein